MVLDFPDAPILDQIWDAPSGSSYRFDGTVWVSTGGGGGGGGTVPPGGALTFVTHDATLTGDGTAAVPLSVVGGAGAAIVTDNISITGDGTAANPLAVNLVDAGAGFTALAAQAEMARRAPLQRANEPPDFVAALLTRVDLMETELAVLRGRQNRPLSPVQRAASRSRRPRKE